MRLIDILTIVALILGPTVAVVITLVNQRREFVRNQRISLFTTLLATRPTPFERDRLRALALIDVVFNDKRDVRQKWADYYDSLSNPQYNDANGGAVRLGKFNDLVATMAQSLGYGKAIGYAELMRVYNPQLAEVANQVQGQTALEWLRVLKNSEHLGAPRKSDATNVVGLPPQTRSQDA